uniref:hypothetical protein n=1 Tax=Pseudomonas aeruginosa TaxID=287 RepID=UPI003F5CF8D9
QNLFNRDYYPLYSQLLRNNNNTSHLPAPSAPCPAPAGGWCCCCCAATGCRAGSSRG